MNFSRRSCGSSISKAPERTMRGDTRNSDDVLAGARANVCRKSRLGAGSLRRGPTPHECWPARCRLPQFAASQKLDPGMGTKFRLAECYEKIDRTASAWALFIEIGDEARGAKRPDREKIARKRAEDLAPKLARMTVLVSPDSANLADLEVRRDGTVLEKAVWGVPTPIDPGEHFLTATAPGKISWQSKSIVVQTSSSVELTIPRLEDRPKEPISTAIAPVTPVVVEKRSLVPTVILGSIALAAVGVGGHCWLSDRVRRVMLPLCMTRSSATRMLVCPGLPGRAISTRGVGISRASSIRPICFRMSAV